MRSLTDFNHSGVGGAFGDTSVSRPYASLKYSWAGMTANANKTRSTIDPHRMALLRIISLYSYKWQNIRNNANRARVCAGHEGRFLGPGGAGTAEGTTPWDPTAETTELRLSVIRFNSQGRCLIRRQQFLRVRACINAKHCSTAVAFRDQHPPSTATLPNRETVGKGRAV